MNNVEEILDDIIRREGGFVNHPADRGGATKFGITEGTLEVYYGRAVTVDDVKNLSEEQAREIYTRQYYVNPRFDTLDEEIQPIVVDTGVLFGPRRAVIFLQSIVNQAGFGPIDEDGILGPDTRGRVNDAVKEMGLYFINAIVEERINYHKMRVAQHPSQQVFLKGWINRAEEFRVAV